MCARDAGRAGRGLTRCPARAGPDTPGGTVTESGGQFAGASERSTKHSPRIDEELEHEVQGMMRAERATRAEEWREVQPPAEGGPHTGTHPAGARIGGPPVGIDPDTVVVRAELARWPARADFPSTGPDLVEAAR